jgi:hypothetical protein
MSPKVSDRISAVAATRKDLQFTVAIAVRTRFALLFATCFVANGRSNVHLLTVVEHTVLRANQHSKTAFFQYLNVVIVGVAHCPTGSVLFGLVIVAAVHESTMTVDPFFEVLTHTELHGEEERRSRECSERISTWVQRTALTLGRLVSFMSQSTLRPSAHLELMLTSGEPVDRRPRKRVSDCWCRADDVELMVSDNGGHTKSGRNHFCT